MGYCHTRGAIFKSNMVIKFALLWFKRYFTQTQICKYLIFWCVVALREVAVDLPVVQQVVVDQVPAPALIVAAQQSHVALALHGRPLGGDADDGHRAERAFPPDLPGVPTFREADLATCAVRALGDGVPVESEAVLLHVHVAGAVVGAQAVLVGLELQEEREKQTAQCCGDHMHD